MYFCTSSISNCSSGLPKWRRSRVTVCRYIRRVWMLRSSSFRSSSIRAMVASFMVQSSGYRPAEVLVGDRGLWAWAGARVDER